MRELKSIDLKTAQSIVQNIIEKAYVTRGDSVAVAVVGSDGRLIAFAAMDGVMPVSIKLAQNKAYTALIGKRDTKYWEYKFGFNNQNFTDEKFTCFCGGVLVEIAEETEGQKQKETYVVGGIGVSGRKGIEDNALANYGKRKEFGTSVIDRDV